MAEVVGEAFIPYDAAAGAGRALRPARGKEVLNVCVGVVVVALGHLMLSEK